jgi:hypothetical protein
MVNSFCRGGFLSEHFGDSHQFFPFEMGFGLLLITACGFPNKCLNYFFVAEWFTIVGVWINVHSFYIPINIVLRKWMTGSSIYIKMNILFGKLIFRNGWLIKCYQKEVGKTDYG